MRKPGKSNLRLLLGVLIPIVVSFFLNFPTAYAVDPEYNLTDIPDGMAEYFNIPAFTAGIIISAGILLFVSCMIAFTLSKRGTQAIAYGVLISDFVTMGALVALGWLPYWIFLVLCLLVAILFAGSLRDLLTGKGG